MWLCPCLLLAIFAVDSHAGVRRGSPGDGKLADVKSQSSTASHSCNGSEIRTSSSSSLYSTHSSSNFITSVSTQTSDHLVSSSSCRSTSEFSSSWSTATATMKSHDHRPKAVVINNVYSVSPSKGTTRTSSRTQPSVSLNFADQNRLVGANASPMSVPPSSSSKILLSTQEMATTTKTSLDYYSSTESRDVNSSVSSKNASRHGLKPSSGSQLVYSERVNGIGKANTTKTDLLKEKSPTNNSTYPAPFDNQCQLWDKKCKGSRKAALDRFFENNGTMFNMVYNAHCVWSTDVKCDGWHLPEAEERALVNYLRSPKCNADFVDWHKTNPGPWTWSERAYSGWSPGTVDFNQIATHTKSVGCCGQCEIYGGGMVDVHYWPVPGANTQCLKTIGTGPLNYEKDLWVTDNRGYPYYKPQSNPWAAYNEHTDGQLGFTALEGDLGDPASQTSTDRPGITAPPLIPRGLAPPNDENEEVPWKKEGAQRVATFKGFHCTSPSVCVGFSSLFVHDACGGLRTLGQIAELVSYTVLAFNPGELSTIAKPFWERADENVPPEFIKPFDFKDLPCPPLDVQRSAGYKPAKGVPYRPVLAPPKRLSYLLPGWSKCILSQASFVGIDPPHTLGPADALAPAPTNQPLDPQSQPDHLPERPSDEQQSQSAAPADKPNDGQPQPTPPPNPPTPGNLNPIYTDSDDTDDVPAESGKQRQSQLAPPNESDGNGDDKTEVNGSNSDTSATSDNNETTDSSDTSNNSDESDTTEGNPAPSTNQDQEQYPPVPSSNDQTSEPDREGGSVGGDSSLTGNEKVPDQGDRVTETKQTPPQEAGKVLQNPSNVDGQGMAALHAALQPANDKGEQDVGASGSKPSYSNSEGYAAGQQGGGDVSPLTNSANRQPQSEPFKEVHGAPDNSYQMDQSSSTTPFSHDTNDDTISVDKNGAGTGPHDSTAQSLGRPVSGSDSIPQSLHDSKSPDSHKVDGGSNKPLSFTTTVANHPLVAIPLESDSGVAISIAGKTLSANSPAITDPTNGDVISVDSSALTIGSSTIPLNVLTRPPNSLHSPTEFAATTVSDLNLAITPVADAGSAGERQVQALIISGHTLLPSSPPLTLTLPNPTDPHKPPVTETLSLDRAGRLVINGTSTIPLTAALSTTSLQPAQHLISPATVTLAGHVATLLPDGDIIVEGVTLERGKKQTATLKDGQVLALTSAVGGEEKVVLGTKTVGWGELVASAQAAATTTGAGKSWVPGAGKGVGRLDGGGAAATGTGTGSGSSPGAGSGGDGSSGAIPFENKASRSGADMAVGPWVVLLLNVLMIWMAGTAFT